MISDDVILAALTDQPTPRHLIAIPGATEAEITVALTVAEMGGKVERLPGNQWKRKVGVPKPQEPTAPQRTALCPLCGKRVGVEVTTDKETGFYVSRFADGTVEELTEDGVRQTQGADCKPPKPRTRRRQTRPRPLVGRVWWNT